MAQVGVRIGLKLAWKIMERQTGGKCYGTCDVYRKKIYQDELCIQKGSLLRHQRRKKRNDFMFINL